ncbi:MAG: DUF6575 domain-containing protein [Ginsengibacter sp.]
MQKKLNISQILVYYDMPELFIATDEVDTNYICLLLEVDENSPSYLSTAISANRLSKFIKGQIELRQVLIEPEINDWYSFNIDNENIIAERTDIQNFPEIFLPEQGFYLNNEILDNSNIVQEVVQKDNAVVHLAISDDKDDFSIDTDDLGDIVKLYSVMLENSFKKGLIEHKVKEKKALIVPMNYKLRAFAASRASFNIHLYSKSQKDLFGNCMVEYGLEKIEQILTEYASDEELINSLKSLKGHAVSSFKKILKKILDENLKLKHKWFAPNQKEVHFKVLDTFKAQKIYDILNLSEELTEEVKELTGVFVQADVERGTWRIKTNDDDKEFSGEATSEELRGITLDTVTYKLVCQEIIEEFKVTEKEKVKYIFKSVIKLDE